MNHQKIYESIIFRAKSENRIRDSYYLRKKENFISPYYDNHHIIPRCMGGGDEKENMQLLTDKEHYICHKLLTYIYKGNRGIVCAFHLMTFSKKYNKLIKSSRDYAYARELVRLTPVSEETKIKRHNIKQSAESNEKRSKALKGRPGKKHTKESNEKNRQAHLGKPVWSKGTKFSKEHCKNISISRILNKTAKGENNPMFGKHHTKESNQRNKEKHIGKKDSNETRIKKSEASKGKNNPMFNKSIYDVWLTKFGKKQADILHNNYKQKQKETASKKEIKVCPHCGVSGKGAGIIRYHFNNCKHKNKEGN